ncbi:ABC transporter substrate-binding protein [Euzebya tangerina]|uniref:ABC transporter substrate-binding protein n=1 Tax=Euzebya tangerina TaxID=591198 RepID=UPI000E317033|nr:ABC transporter substrate-binding protein [Euzebya tangerina]
MASSGTIASLIPSGTDIVAALGLADRLVGVSHECDHAIASGRPVLTSSSLSRSSSAAEIDAAVSASVASGDSLYRTDRAALHRLRPDVVLSQDVCDVCAVNGEVARGDVPDGTDLVMLTAVRLHDLWDDLRRVGRATGATGAAEEVIATARAALDATRVALADVPRRRVVALDWGDPPYAAGHWVPDLIDVAGGTDLLATSDPMSRRITWQEIERAAPDVVLFLPCGYSLGQAASDAQGRWERRCTSIGAELWALDATRLLSRCTPTAVTAAASALAGVLHPSVVGDPTEEDARRII